MSAVTMKLPSLLAPFADGQTRVTLEAETVASALEALCGRHSALRVHLFDENGSLRQHVLCFHNDTNTRWMESLEVELREGDEVSIVQAVSGG